jgi:hypothetical protein
MEHFIDNQMPLGDPSGVPQPEIPAEAPNIQEQSNMGMQIPNTQGQPDIGMQASPNPVYDGNPYFMGENALIKFSGGEEGFGQETFWLVDKDNKTIRPFESKNALDEVFGQEVPQALQNVVSVVPPSTDEKGNITDGVLSGFTILGPEYAIRDDGTSKELNFSPSQLQGRYGKPIDEKAENMAVEVIDAFLNILKKSESKTGIKANFIDELKRDEQLMAFYISSMAYGNYQLNDIYGDILKRSKEK